MAQLLVHPETGLNHQAGRLRLAGLDTTDLTQWITESYLNLGFDPHIGYVHLVAAALPSGDESEA